MIYPPSSSPDAGFNCHPSFAAHLPHISGIPDMLPEHSRAVTCVGFTRYFVQGFGYGLCVIGASVLRWGRVGRCGDAPRSPADAPPHRRSCRDVSVSAFQPALRASTPSDPYPEFRIRFQDLPAQPLAHYSRAILYSRPEIESKSTIKIKRMPGCLQTLWNHFWREIPLTKSTAYPDAPICPDGSVRPLSKCSNLKLKRAAHSRKDLGCRRP
jgi:hypothetical protein